MLESMIEHPRPTRAEITDVANAIYDGTSAIMLSGETAAGKYPVEAVKTMDAIARRTEMDIDYCARLKKHHVERHLSIADAVSHTACSTAMEIEADAIIAVSKSGETGRLLSKYRPTQPIFACIVDEFAARRMAISWGIYPIVTPLMTQTDDLLEKCVELCRATGKLNNGDLVVITAGVPVGVSGTTNMVKVQVVGNAMINGIGIGKNSATGPLCICESHDDLKAKFTPGCVLVVRSTSNDVVEYMKEAAAIIAEEAGQNSHAAIVGYTLGKPVIVGAIAATKNLKDGVIATVDASKNSVHLVVREKSEGTEDVLA
jgi:pyruvate kinase